MVVRRWVWSLGVVPAGLFYAACVSESTPSGPQTGEEGGPCFTNGTCNAGLVCVVPNKCVVPDAGVDGGADAAPPSDGAAADASDGAADAGDSGSGCGTPGQPCCQFETCQGGGCCVPLGGAYPPGICVGNSGICPGGPACMNGSCGNTCGAPGQTCCPARPADNIPNDYCTAPAMACVNGTCAACGYAGEPCCAGNQCASGYTCGGTTCN